MGTLYLVRHGQASFGAEDYDELSALGARQCRALGEWFRSRDIAFEAVLRGTLKRHVQSLAALSEGHGSVPEAHAWPGLNEYDSHAVVRCVHAEPLAPAATPEAYKHHFRLLREGLARWMSGSVQPEGMPTYADWAAGIAAALDHVRAHHRGHVLVVSSGGPIATAVGHVLGTPPQATIELNLQLRNSAVTQFQFSARRHALMSFNHLPHLEHDAERREWVTYA